MKPRQEFMKATMMKMKKVLRRRKQLKQKQKKAHSK